MAISRYDRLPRYDWSWEGFIPKLPEINYELLAQTMQQQQSQYDLAKGISEKMPNVLQNEADLNLLKEYQTLVDSGLENVSQKYLKEGLGAGSSAYRDYVNSIRKAWRPNVGTAAILQDRYNSYALANKAIDDQFKDDVSPVNKTLAKLELQNQLNKPILNPDGTYTQITTPTLYKNPNLRVAINDMLKQIGESGDTEFLGNTNKDWWITKIQSEGRPEERIKLAYQALSEQPEFAAQIQRDAQYRSLGIDPQEYQTRFNESLDKQYQQNEKLLSGKNAKQLLEQQGYDVSNLDNAKKQFLQDQKDAIEQRKNNFDLNTELTRDISNDYQNYALGFANQKIKKDLIFNQALKAQMENQRAKEKNAALFGIRDALVQEKAPSVTVTTGVAQQLPEINKHYDTLKQDLSNYKTQLDKSLNDPNSVFNGWKFENVAFAHNLWNNTMKKLPSTASEEQKQQAFSQALRNNSDYFNQNPEQAAKVYQQMSSGNGGLQPAIQAYQEKQNEIERLDNARTYVGSQYINTPEGKEAFKGIAAQRKVGETDEQLIQRALSNPEQFNVKAPATTFAEPGGFRGRNLDYNPAEVFKNTMQRDVPKQQKAGINYNWGDMATYQVGFNKDDKSFQPIGDELANAITNGTQYQFSSEGKQGLTFRDAKGDVISNISKVDMGDFVVAKNSKGQPVLNYTATVTEEGGKPKQATVSIDIVPGSPEQEQINEGLKRAYIAKYNAGEMQSANAILDIMNVNGSLSDAGTQVQINSLTKNKAQQLNDVYKQDASGKLVPISYMGYKGIDTKNSYQTIDPNTGSILNYETYGLIDANGNKYAADVFVTPDGKKVITDIKSNMSSITQERLGKQIRATTPVERETTKLPNGALINLMENE